MADTQQAPPPPPAPDQWQQQQYSYQYAQPPSYGTVPPAASDDQPPLPPPDPPASEPSFSQPLPPPAAQAPQGATAYGGYGHYDAAAYAAYHQQYNAYYGYAAQQQQQQQQWAAYYAQQQQQQQQQQPQQSFTTYQQPAYQQPQTPITAQLPADSQPTATYAATAAAPAAQPAASGGVSGNAAPWQNAAAKVAAKVQAQASGYNAVPPPAAAAGPAARPIQKPGIAKSFCIQPQTSKFKIGGANGFAAAASHAYVKVAEKPAAKPAAIPSQFPPAMRAYVERAFLAARTPEQKKALQPALKAVIDAASAKGELWMTSWDTMPLPDIPALMANAPVTSAIAAAVDKLQSPTAKSERSRWDVMRRGPQSWQAAQPAQLGRPTSASEPDLPPPPDWGQMDGRQRKRQKLKSSKHRYIRSPSPSASDSSNSDGRGRGGKRRTAMSAVELSRRAKRAGRFGDGRAEDSIIGGPVVVRPKGPSRRDLISLAATSGDVMADEIDLAQFTIKGTCQRLEKSYFRLTAAPDPASVRPEPVLRAALDRLLRLIRQGDQKYLYLLDQFKAMRQDCTVQHLRNELAVRIYEAHARAALEYGDSAEYNQCQTQLNALALEGVPGAASPEFLAYRLLYQTVHARDGETSALLSAMRLVKPEMAGKPEVAHALQVRQAVYTDDAAALFRLYAAAPNMGRALLDMFVPVARWRALQCFVRAFKPALSVALLARLLGFVARPRQSGDASSGDAKKGGATALEVLPGCSAPVFPGKAAAQEEEAAGVDACVQWLQAHGAIVTAPTEGEASGAMLDCKASAGQLHPIQDTTAVAHGDDKLDLNDFLSKIAAS